MPSCMRAPPEAAKMMNGVPLSTAVSSPLITASPAAMPSEPPMKSKSCTPITTGKPSSLPKPSLMASLVPVLARASLWRWGERQRARNQRPRRDSHNEPGLVVEHRLEPHHRPHAHVIVGAGDDELVRLDVLVEHELPGLRALNPEIFRGLAAR